MDGLRAEGAPAPLTKGCVCAAAAHAQRCTQEFATACLVCCWRAAAVRQDASQRGAQPLQPQLAHRWLASCCKAAAGQQAGQTVSEYNCTARACCDCRCTCTWYWAVQGCATLLPLPAASLLMQTRPVRSAERVRRPPADRRQRVRLNSDAVTQEQQAAAGRTMAAGGRGGCGSACRRRSHPLSGLLLQQAGSPAARTCDQQRKVHQAEGPAHLPAQRLHPGARW